MNNNLLAFLTLSLLSVPGIMHCMDITQMTDSDILAAVRLTKLSQQAHKEAAEKQDAESAMNDEVQEIFHKWLTATRAQFGKITRALDEYPGYMDMRNRQKWAKSHYAYVPFTERAQKEFDDTALVIDRRTRGKAIKIDLAPLLAKPRKPKKQKAHKPSPLSNTTRSNQ